MINESKPTTTLTNTTKVSIAETWGAIATTWASETRTWLDCASLIDNVSLSLTDPLWSTRSFPWLLTTPWGTVSTGMTNISKP